MRLDGDHCFVRVRIPSGVIQEMDVEEYIKGVVPREMYASWHMEALKAQSVAARTYAMAEYKHRGSSYDVCSTTCCQVYSAARDTRCNEAVEATCGVIGTQNGNPVKTYFSARCGGHTCSYSNWEPSYLRSVECLCVGSQFGHDQGLCQYGAKAYAESGKTWLEILQHYYNLEWRYLYGQGDLVDGTTPPPPPPPPDPPEYDDDTKLRIIWRFLWDDTEMIEMNGRRVLALKNKERVT